MINKKQKKNIEEVKISRPPSVKETLNIDTMKEIEETLGKTQSQVSIWERLGPYFVGFVSFIIGLILFFPFDDLALDALSKIDMGEGAPEFDNLSVSTLGSINIDGLNFTIPKLTVSQAESQSTQKSKFTATSLEGDISIFSFFFFDELSLKINIQNFEAGFLSDLPLSFKGEKISCIFDGKSLEEGSKKSGKIQLNAINLIGNYDEELPVVGEKLGGFIIDNIIGEATLRGNVISISQLQIESNLATIKVNGKFNIKTQDQMNLNFNIEPKGFLQKYSANNVELLLKNFGVLHDDGKMFLECIGSFSKCSFKKAVNNTNRGLFK